MKTAILTFTASARYVAMGLFVALMILGYFTGNPDTVEWPTGTATR